MSLEINEQREHAEHGAHDNFIGGVSITIAVLAVVTAIVNSLEQVETSAAITDASRAVLAQNEASDQWNLYQSKSVKKHIYTLAAEEYPAVSDKYKKTAAKESKDGDDALKQARDYEGQRDGFNEREEKHEMRHHRIAVGATLLEMGIAIATVAIITRKRLWWFASIGLGLVGAALAAAAYAGFGVV